MLLKNDESKKLNEEVVVDVETTEMVELDKEAKKAKLLDIAKKGLKFAGVVLVGVIGYAIGKASNSGDEIEMNNSEVIDAEFTVEETEAE